jgi:hypothetical protein
MPFPHCYKDHEQALRDIQDDAHGSALLGIEDAGEAAGFSRGREQEKDERQTPQQQPDPG